MKRRSSSVSSSIFAHLVRGPEAVEEVQERHARLERGGVGDRRRSRGPPAPTRRRASRSRSAGRPSRPSGRRRWTGRGWPGCARQRACMKGVSSPAILYMLGIISSRPCDAVKVVVSAPACSAPWTAPAAPPSDCISTTSGTVPQMFCRPSADHSSDQLAHRRGRGDRVDRDHLAHAVRDGRGRLVAVDGDRFVLCHSGFPPVTARRQCNANGRMCVRPLCIR